MDKSVLFAYICKLYFNNSIVFSAYKLFSIITAAELTLSVDYIRWFNNLIDEMGLEEGVHYSIRGRNNFYVSGHVALDILIDERPDIEDFLNRRFAGEERFIPDDVENNDDAE